MPQKYLDFDFCSCQLSRIGVWFCHTWVRSKTKLGGWVHGANERSGWLHNNSSKFQNSLHEWVGVRKPRESAWSSAPRGFSVPVTTHVHQQMKMTLSLTFEGWTGAAARVFADSWSDSFHRVWNYVTFIAISKLRFEKKKCNKRQKENVYFDALVHSVGNLFSYSKKLTSVQTSYMLFNKNYWLRKKTNNLEVDVFMFVH